MGPPLLSSLPVRARPGPRPSGGRPDRAERRRRAEHDRRAAQLAELHLMREVLAEAGALVGAGWVQDAWFAVRDGEGRLLLTAYDVGVLRSRPVAGACLVGAVVHAGGGLGAVRSQLVQRTLDLTWHALREDPDRPVRWCPPPSVREAHVRDLTRWNDHRGREAREVVSLLGSARELAGSQSRLLRRA